MLMPAHRGLVTPVAALSGIPAPSGYQAQGVNFDGLTKVSCASLSCTDNNKLTIVWCSRQTTRAANTSVTFWAVDTANNLFPAAYSDPSPPTKYGIQYFLGFPDPTSISTTDNENIWVVNIFSCDYTVAAHAAAYLNNVLGPAFTSVFPLSILMNGLDFVIGDDNLGDPYFGDIADFQVWVGTSIVEADNTISTPNRRLFIDASGKPVDPAVAAAALGPPTVRCSATLGGPASSFATNQGTGGAFTTTGTLTLSATTP